MTFRILALDGGGIRGVFSASVLAEIESNTGRSVADHFDLIVGTSTGAILAIGLAFGIPAERLERLYVEHGPTIFPQRMGTRLYRGIKGMFLPKHAQAPLRAALEEILGERRLGDATRRLVIPTFDVHKGRACTFKTPHHSRAWQDQELRAVDVALAAAAAPTYFGATEVAPRVGSSYIDGGVWANTPVMVALVEALARCDARLDQIAMLSVGTTSALEDLAKRARAGLMGWRWKILNPVFVGQAIGALNQAELLLGSDRFVRIDHVLPKEVRLDDASAASIAKLRGLGRGIGRANAITDIVQRLFLNGRPVSAYPRFEPPSRRDARE
ncbi:CBASS cGAMP-activated phospholipase [Sphingomonas soli]|uniref:CBASS cGAMP-activated phospholipase n=1 Tax=Sphingomonas soli TaxID=266127 RepID=UPI00082A0C06|nr:CBASS cGAMP-activated phospholipase [Sphingomonas soli]